MPQSDRAHKPETKLKNVKCIFVSSIVYPQSILNTSVYISFSRALFLRSRLVKQGDVR